MNEEDRKVLIAETIIEDANYDWDKEKDIGLTIDSSANVHVDGIYYVDGSAGFTGDVSAGQTMRFKGGILVEVI
jgi:hypothetical protein